MLTLSRPTLFNPFTG
ncbi:hypothetical protein AYI69_g9318, partial [Smittium culicis]